MYLGFNAVVHIHETLPPDDTSMLWLKTIPIRTIVPTSEFLFESKIDVIDKTRQLFKIYEFESSPEVRVYSTSLERWETCSVENTI